MKRLGTSFALVLALFLQCSTAEAASLLKISARTAQGTTETGVQKLVLGSGQGINLSFLPVRETIQKVWLDDLRNVAIEFDGCLTSNAIEPSESSQGRTSACSGDSGAAIIHVRQLPKSINFPVLTSTRSNLVQLTVITAGSEGRKIYQFQLALGGTNPPYSTIEIVPDALPAPAQLGSVSAEYQAAVLSQLSRGLAYAESKKLVDRASAAYAQLQACIALMQQGTPFAKATELSGVPPKLVDAIRGYAANLSPTRSVRSR